MSKKLAVLMVVALVVAVVGLGYQQSVQASSHLDHWYGTLADNSDVSNAYDGASGQVRLNYRSGRDSWVVNVNASGLVPGVSYEAIFYDGDVLSLGCFVANAGGVGHLNAKDFAADDIDPTITNPTEARVNVRLDDDSTPACDGVGGSAVLSTWTQPPWNGSGLVPVGSNRPQ